MLDPDSPPHYLNDDAKAIWKSTLTALIATYGDRSDTEADLLANYCYITANIQRLQKHITPENELIICRKTGKLIKNPRLMVLMQYTTQQKTLAVELGIGVTSKHKSSRSTKPGKGRNVGDFFREATS